MGQKVLAIKAPAVAPKKIVAANQAAIDALALGSGNWRVEGVPGLSIRCWRHKKSYLLTRRVRGKLAQKVLGEMSLKAAKAAAMAQWTRLKPAPAGGRKTFEQAFDEYLEQRKLADRTKDNYRYNLDRYLADWKARALVDVGNDRGGVRSLYHAILNKYGAASANQVAKLVSSVYRYARRADPDLPETPTVSIDLATIPSRDWALEDNELREFGAAVAKLGTIKRMWWLTALLTGARRGSVEALRWADIDTERKTIFFATAKGNRVYQIPASDRFMALLAAYRASDDVPPSEWVFPSNLKPDGHLTNVRDCKQGVKSAHHLRHSLRTRLAQLGASDDQNKLLLGHTLGGVSGGYVSAMAASLTEALRPIVNAVSEHYAKILNLA
jgi:integrase